jgi:hypothetical protein
MLKKRWFSILLSVVIFFSGIGGAFWAMRPPAPPAETGPDYKAYKQMLVNIEAMTREPHPSGSKELSDVRAYLLAQIEGMGLKYEVLSTVCSLNEITADNAARQKNNVRKSASPKKVIDPGSGKVISPLEMMRNNIRTDAVFDENDNVTLHNILVKLDAPGTNRGILFSAHYDSEFKVPGACDDMTSVGALLEALSGRQKILILKTTFISCSQTVRNSGRWVRKFL